MSWLNYFLEGSYRTFIEIKHASISRTNRLFEPHREKTNEMICAPSEDSDQPGHPPSLNIVFAVRLKKARILRYPLSAQQILWSAWASDWADAQADLSLRWAQMPVCWLCHDAAHLFRLSILFARLCGFKPCSGYFWDSHVFTPSNCWLGSKYVQQSWIAVNQQTFSEFWYLDTFFRFSKRLRVLSF